MGQMHEYEAWEQEDMQAAMHQCFQERQQVAQEAAKRLERAISGMGLSQYLETLCREAGIDSPYK